MSHPRLPIASAFFVFIAGAFAADALAQPEYRIASAPGWTHTIPLDFDRAPHGDAAGVYYHLIDQQVRVVGADVQDHSRIVLKVLSQQGISDASQLTIDYDPEYQNLVLHDAAVYRSGERRQALVADNIQILHREEGLEWQIYDGRKSVNIIIDDLRVGDIVEYRYTIQGANPTFDGRFSHSFTAQYSFPVGTARYRLLWPSDRTLHVNPFGDAVEPEIEAAAAVTEYVWQVEDVPGLIADGDTPAWYDPYPWVQLSEWDSWEEVVSWALPMYTPEAVSHTAADLSEAGAGPENRLLAALRFAQDDVRYLGFEMGRGSHEPRSPAEVLRTRFGDCKDKSRLLISLLAGMDIEAYPALVHSSRGRTLPDWHPSPDAFNHVIVVAMLDGKRYWLDPTLARQGGTLEHLYQPDYEHALIIRDGGASLTEVEVPQLTGPEREIESTLDLTDGLDEPAHFNIRTIYRGSEADAVRSQIAWQSKPQMEKIYLNYYAEIYPGIEPADSIAIYDDLDLNRLIIDEGYLIKDLWEETDTPGRVAALIYPTEIRDMIMRPSTVLRSSPLALSHPTHVLYTQTVMFPERWNVEEESLHLSDAGMEFFVDASYHNEVMTVRYEYRTLADHVMPEDAEAHLKNVDRIFENLGYEIYRSPEGIPFAPSWVLILFALAALVPAVHFARKAYRYDPGEMPLTDEERDPRYTGLRGWLILVGFGVIANVVAFPVLNIAMFVLVDASAWSQITTASSDVYHVLWAPALIFEVVMNSVLAVFAVLAAVLFFKKRQSFPRVYMIFLIAATAYFVLNDIILSSLPVTEFAEPDWPGTIRGVFSAAVWIAYLQTSKRVESTFVERRAEMPAVATAAM